MAAEVRPIRTKRDYETALEAARLWGAKAATPKGHRLDVLAAYETEHHPMDPPDPVEAINYRMEQQGLTYRDLEEIVSTRTRIAEVLSRKRELSIATIHRMHERLGISAKVLIRPGARAWLNRYARLRRGSAICARVRERDVHSQVRNPPFAKHSGVAGGCPGRNQGKPQAVDR